MCEGSVELRQQRQHVAGGRECHWLTSSQERIERTGLVQDKGSDVGPVDEVLCVQVVVHRSICLAAGDRGNHFFGSRTAQDIYRAGRGTELRHVVV